MRSMTVYVAADGSRWDTPEGALGREHLTALVAEAMAPLGPRPDDAGCRFSNGHGCKRHDPEAVALARDNLLGLSRRPLDSWIKTQAELHGKRWPDDFRDVHPSWFLRMLDGDGPLERAWGRMACVDKQGREWGQPYFADHPEAAEGRDAIGDTNREGPTP